MEKLMPPPRRRRALRVSAAVAGSLVLTLAAGYLSPAYADDAVALTDSQVADIMFGAAVRLKDPGPDYYRSVVATAELLDWRTKHQSADATQVTAHLAGVEQQLDTGLTDADRQLSPTELLARQLQVLYATPGVDITGPQSTNLLAVVTARDLAPGVLNIDERLSGAQQRYTLDIAYSNAQHDLWMSLRNEVGPHQDGALATAWHNELGKSTPAQPAGLDPKWSFDDLKNDVGQLKNLVDMDALSKAAKQGSTQFYDELRKQFQALRDKLNGEQSKLSSAIEDLLTKAGVPGKPGERGPTADQLKQAAKDQKDRQDVIDGVKTGLDVLVWIADKIDAGFAKHLAGFAETAYKVATAVNQLYSAIATLAASTGIGATTFGVCGAAIGAVIGLVQVFVGLFGGGDDGSQQAAQKQVIDTVKQGFEQVKAMLQTMYEQMNKRFDRIDASLAKIYQDMMAKFATVISLLYDVKGDVRAVQSELLTLESQVQAFSQQLINQVSDSDKTEFLNAAHNYVDYAYQNNHALPNYDTGGNDYVTGVNRFTTTATSTARNANFTYTDFSQSDSNVAIGAHGPMGAIDYLAHRAGAYGMSIPLSGNRVPNADLWAEAARAYTLTAVQNPQFAATESDARTDQILAAGRQIRDTALKFSAPVAPGTGPWVATNPLFAGLLQENSQLRTQFVDSLSALEPQVMSPGRQIRLWNKSTGRPVDRPASNQIVDVDAISTNPTDGSVNRLKAVPPTVGRCGGGGPTAPTPDAVTGRDLPRPVLLGLYADAGWAYSVCWANAHWSAPRSHVDQAERILVGPKNGPKHYETKYHMRRIADLLVNFEESVTVPGPGGGTILGRTTSELETFFVCSWVHMNSPGTAPDTCPDNPGNANDKMNGTQFRNVVSAANPDGAGESQAQSLITERRARYFDLVASKLDQDALPAARELNTSTRLLQAYTNVAFPRAKESDDQLHALLYGTNALPANLRETPILEAVYAQAAQNIRAGRSATQDQELLDEGPGNCVPEGRMAGDPVAGCIWSVGQDRTQALAERFELHFQALYRSEEIESQPLVDEAIRNLELVHTYVRARGVVPAAVH